MNNVDNVLDKMKKMHVFCSCDQSFCNLTTLKVGGKINLTVYPDSYRKIVETMRFLQRSGTPYFVLGNGSNVLASDEFFDGVVVCTKKARKITVCGNKIIAECGASGGSVFAVAKSCGLSGVEFFGCIPSTAGAAVRGNAGCYGQDAASVVTSVTALCGDGKIRTFDNEQCGFSKRNSIFKAENAVVLSVTMDLTATSRENVATTFEQMRRRKTLSQPTGVATAGSTLFHDKLSLSYYLDKAGTKGYRVGGAEVSKKHAGFVINIDKAAAKDIYYIIQYQKQRLWEAYGLCAKTEVSLVGWQ